MAHTGSNPELGEIVDRLVAHAAAGDKPSFIELARLAGLDPARDFIGASLEGRSFRDADLRGYDFSHADLTGADFRGTNLTGVSFEGADTTGARFEGASFDDGAHRATATGPASPPAEFDLDQARRMILAGRVPPAAWIPFITRLDFDGTELRDLGPLASLVALTRLDFDRTKVVDLSPLAGLSALQTLYCGGTQIVDLSPLAGLSALRDLYLGDTPVTDLSPLAGIGRLEIHGKDGLPRPRSRRRR